MLKNLAAQLRMPSGLLGSLVARIMGRYNKVLYYELDRHTGIRDGMRVLEIGFGPGFGIGYFLEKYELSYLGIDYSALMYEKALRRFAAPVARGRLELMHGDFLECELEPGSLDRVIFANVSYFWKELEPPFSRIWSMLKHGGKLVFFMEDKDRLERTKLTNNEHFHRHDASEVVACLGNCGFTQVRTHRLLDKYDDLLIIEACKS
jgi:SAM-dependent methyltransferase